MTIRTLVLAIVALLAIRYVLREGLRSLVTSVTTDYAAKCLTMVGHTTSAQDGSTFITGSFKNGCDRKFSHVTVAFILDSSPRIDVTQLWSPARSRTPTNREPETTLNLPKAPILAYSSDVQPGETRKFRSAMSIPENSIYHFDKISGY
jgi:hypothetical protein